MKKKTYALLLITGIFLIAFSYALDEKLNVLLKNARYPIFDMPLSIITNFAVAMLIMLLVPCAILYKKNKNAAYMLLSAFVLSVLLSIALKVIVMRHRPMGDLTYPFTGILGYSFPSMHSMAVFALLPVLVKCLPKQKIFWIAFAFLVAFSRIYFGFHFLSDVVFGAIAGCTIGSFLLKSGFIQKMS